MNRSLRLLAACFVCGIIICALPASAADRGSYKLLQKINLPGDGGWDYLTFDAASNHLFISRATHVMVVDPGSGKVAGDIPNTPGVHGIALANKFNKGFISNGRGNDVTVFDLKTLKEVAHVPTGERPDAIIFDPATNRVFAMNGKSGSVTAINAKDNTVAGTVELGGTPEFAAADGKGHVYVNLEDKSKIAALDSRNLKLLSTWDLSPCQEPSGLAMDRVHRRLFAGCDNKMMAIVDADSGKVIATPPIGDGVDANGFDPGKAVAFSSNGEGTLTIVHEVSPSEFKVVQNVETQRGARTMAVDPKSHKVYLVTASFGEKPAPTAENPNPRPPFLPNSFVLLVVGPEK